MKWIFVLLLGLLLILQYQLWLGDKGFIASHRLKQKIEKVEVSAVKLQKKNESLMDKIKRLKTDPELVEGYARQDLGMIKKGEVFYRLDGLKKGE
jgi:cell division protein FtsB